MKATKKYQSLSDRKLEIKHFNFSLFQLSLQTFITQHVHLVSSIDPQEVMHSYHKKYHLYIYMWLKKILMITNRKTKQQKTERKEQNNTIQFSILCCFFFQVKNCFKLSCFSFSFLFWSYVSSISLKVHLM